MVFHANVNASQAVLKRVQVIQSWHGKGPPHTDPTCRSSGEQRSRREHPMVGREQGLLKEAQRDGVVPRPLHWGGDVSPFCPLLLRPRPTQLPGPSSRP